MKKKTLIFASTIVLLASCSNSSSQETSEDSSELENVYYQVSSDNISITEDASYEVTLTAEEDWQFDVEEGDDVTTWLVDEDETAALSDTKGVATVDGVSDDGETLVLTIDASQITGFSSNGRTDLYVEPDEDAMSGTGDNHASYGPVMAQIGEYVIPTISIDGEIDGEYTSEDGLSFNDDTVTFELTLDEDFDADLVDNSGASISLEDGDGYYASDYTYSDEGLSTDWSDGSATYTIDPDDLTINNDGYTIGENGGGRGWSELGGDGNGNYNLNFSLQGLEYNGLPVTTQDFRVHVYAYGRTFSLDDGSIYANDYVKWSTDAEDNLPVLADQYSDDLVLSWANGIDASKLAEDDVTLTMESEYGDTLELEAGTDFTVETTKTKTTITVSYTYWANAPVYTKLTVDVASDNLSWDDSQYKIKDISYSYDIASVYVYNVMAGGQTGTQTWTIYGLDGLTEWQQLFDTPTYTLSYTDADGNTQYYSESNGGSFVDAETDATAYDASDDVNIALVGNTGYFTRQFDQTEDKTVNGTTYTFDKVYSSAESAIKNPNDIEGVTVKAGYIIGDGWEDHLRWSWQDFVNEGYQGGRS